MVIFSLPVAVLSKTSAKEIKARTVEICWISQLLMAQYLIYQRKNCIAHPLRHTIVPYSTGRTIQDVGQKNHVESRRRTSVLSFLICPQYPRHQPHTLQGHPLEDTSDLYSTCCGGWNVGRRIHTENNWDKLVLSLPFLCVGKAGHSGRQQKQSCHCRTRSKR